VRGIDQAFLSHNFLVYLAFALVPIIAFILNRTTLGLKIRAVGQSPQAADTLGVSVERIRYLTVTIGGVLSGVAGASLTIALNNIFQPNMTSGLGFIAVALVYFAGWRPVGILIGAMLFSIAYAMQFRAQILDIPISPDIAVMLPYLVTIVALVIAVQRVQQPAALTKIFERGE
jgi:simple sugar transport system permease protein